MDVTLQAKLLRFLQEGYIRRIGDNTTHAVDVRIIAALNENPYEAIASGKLRSDLFYRLNVINFSLPPLRETKNDIIELGCYFLDYFNKELNKNVNGFSEEVMEFFKKYNWPGNTRELRHTVEHAINIAEGSMISINDLPDYINTKKSNDSKDNNPVLTYDENYTGSLNEQIERFERKIIINALKQYDCNVSKTAKKLSVPRQTLYYKMEKLNIKLDKSAD